jgi:hypothetical protein
MPLSKSIPKRCGILHSAGRDSKGTRGAVITTAIAVCLSLTGAFPAQANVGTGMSSAYSFDTNVGVDVDASLTAIVTVQDNANATVDLGPLTPTSGAAPAPYNVNSGPGAIADGNVNAGVNLVGVQLGVGTTDFAGVLNTNSTSNVDGTSGSKSSSGTAIVTDLDLKFGNVNAVIPIVADIALPLLRITSSTVSSVSTVSGPGDGVTVFTPTVVNQVENFSIQILGLDVTNSLLDLTTRTNLAGGVGVTTDVDVTVNLATALSASIFNSVVGVTDNSAQLSGTLRITTLRSTSSSLGSGSAEGYALRIELNGVSIGANLDVAGITTTEVGTDIDGVVTVSGSSAYEAVPEPNAVMLALLGGSTLIFWRRRFQG